MITLEQNLPGLQIYQLADTGHCDSLIDKLNHVRTNKLSENHNVTHFKSLGYQSGNLIDLNDLEILEFSLLMRFHLAKNFGLAQNQLDFVFLHFLDYAERGMMEEHDHKDKEDLTFLLYLNDCADGDTVFYLNNANPCAKTRSSMPVKPKKGRLAVFSSMISHYGSFTTESKKIFAGGMAYNL